MKRTQRYYPKHPLYSDSLAFHVGAYIYYAVCSDRELYNDEHDELEACALESRRLLVVSSIVEPDRREECIIHELTHAWGFAVGKPIDEEARCQVTAMVAISYMRDIEAQGGRRAILNMPMIRVMRIGTPKPERRKTVPMRRNRYTGSGRVRRHFNHYASGRRRTINQLELA